MEFEGASLAREGYVGTTARVCQRGNAEQGAMRGTCFMALFFIQFQLLKKKFVYLYLFNTCTYF